MPFEFVGGADRGTDLVLEDEPETAGCAEGAHEGTVV